MEKTKSLKKKYLNKSIGIICYDSGGAEILSSFVRLNSGNYNFTLKGPAIDIFKKKFKNLKNISLSKNLKISNKFITGSGLGSDLEYKAILKAKYNKKKVYTFLDHWTNYKKRFIRKKKIIYPDQIWVGDLYAKKKVLKFQKNVKVIKNPYFLEKKKIFKKIRKKINKNIILFASSNTDRIKSKIINDEIIFNKFLKYKLDFYPKHKIILRLHPTESKTKYKKFLNSKFNIVLDNNKELVKTLSSCSMVFGHNSMVLPVAYLCGLKTYNILVGRKPSIPKHYITKLIK